MSDEYRHWNAFVGGRIGAMSALSFQRPTVFLDRDGTLNKEIGYIHNLSELVLIDGASAAVRLLNEHRVAAVLVTNQSGAARGYYPEEHIRELNARLVKLLAADGAFLDGLYYCAHLPEGVFEPLARQCQCRKPLTGLVEQAYREHTDLDPSKAYVVGDKASDMDLARNCGAKAVLVRTGFGQAVLEHRYQWAVSPDYTADDIRAAIAWILADLGLS